MRIVAQLIQVFPHWIIDVATALIFCDAGSESSITRLDWHFRLTDEEKSVMRGDMKGPTPEVAPFWAMFRLRNKGAVR